MMTGLITRIAWLYYKEGLRASQVATMLGLSRSKAGRLLQRAENILSESILSVFTVAKAMVLVFSDIIEIRKIIKQKGRVSSENSDHRGNGNNQYLTYTVSD